MTGVQTCALPIYYSPNEPFQQGGLEFAGNNFLGARTATVPEIQRVTQAEARQNPNGPLTSTPHATQEGPEARDRLPGMTDSLGPEIRRYFPTTSENEVFQQENHSACKNNFDILYTKMNTMQNILLELHSALRGQQRSLSPPPRVSHPEHLNQIRRRHTSELQSQ